jgi:hypothetical protein
MNSEINTAALKKTAEHHVPERCLAPPATAEADASHLPYFGAIPADEFITPPAANTPPLAAESAPRFVLPEVTIEHFNPGEPTLTRAGVIAKKRLVDERRIFMFQEMRGMSPSPEKNRLYNFVQDCVLENQLLEEHLQDKFIPQHSSNQLLSPKSFFMSPLFRVRSISCKREAHLEFELPTSFGKPTIRYSGPELRQSDGMMFLCLLNMLRDVEVGTAVSLPPEATCLALYGRYDGHARAQLQETIRRLQRGLILFKEFTVQLCLRFDHPRFGPWTVGLDSQVVKLFRASPEVWLRMQHRAQLPEGLATWLFAYIESQTRLIPMQLNNLQTLCGSNAGKKGFTNRMRIALSNLTSVGVIDGGWSIKQGVVRWMKARTA